MNTPIAQDLFVKMQAFVMGLLPLDIDHVIQGLGNGVPMPDGPFVCMTATSQRRLSTNIEELDALTDSRSVMMPTEYAIQIDCYGPASSDYATTLSAMWRDPYGCTAMEPTADPLYSTDPMQAPLINGEENYEQRWTFSALLQFNPIVTVAQQFADTLELEVVSVDAEFPPSP